MKWWSLLLWTSAAAHIRMEPCSVSILLLFCKVRKNSNFWVICYHQSQNVQTSKMSSSSVQSVVNCILIAQTILQEKNFFRLFVSTHCFVYYMEHTIPSNVHINVSMQVTQRAGSSLRMQMTLIKFAMLRDWPSSKTIDCSRKRRMLSNG